MVNRFLQMQNHDQIEAMLMECLNFHAAAHVMEGLRRLSPERLQTLGELLLERPLPAAA